MSHPEETWQDDFHRLQRRLIDQLEDGLETLHNNVACMHLPFVFEYKHVYSLRRLQRSGRDHSKESQRTGAGEREDEGEPRATLFSSRM